MNFDQYNASLIIGIFAGLTVSIITKAIDSVIPQYGLLVGAFISLGYFLFFYVLCLMAGSILNHLGMLK
ncbi:hypothetical protein KAR52_01850 [Candidatus Pacearchaeota archaeon]|nr:hypothetical protein [Candidatus Pacearchaeota archaeon]